MEKLWDLLNSLQVVELQKLFDARSPGNVGEFTDFFDDITSVKLIESEPFVRNYYYMPE